MGNMVRFPLDFTNLKTNLVVQSLPFFRLLLVNMTKFGLGSEGVGGPHFDDRFKKSEGRKLRTYILVDVHSEMKMLMFRNLYTYDVQV